MSDHEFKNAKFMEGSPTNAKPELVTWKRFDLQITEHPYSSSSVRMIETVNGSYALHSEIFGLISQLTAERDAALENEKAFGDWQKEAARAYNANLRAENAEKRVKELEEGRDLDKVVLDEGIEIINELETSNKLLSERVAVLEGAVAAWEAVGSAAESRTITRESGALLLIEARAQSRRARTALEGK